MRLLKEYGRVPKPAAQPRTPERRKSGERWIIVGVLVAVAIWGLASIPGSVETPPVETTALRISDFVKARIYN
jgi:hypothetical protein